MLRSTLIAAAVAWCLQSAWAAPLGFVDGVPVEGSYSIEGNRVVLNGAALRRRAFFRTDVTAIYLREPHQTVAEIEAAGGAKRLQLTMMRDVPGSIVSRYFISDFKAVASEAEFKSLIGEIGLIGSIYANIHQVSKGDVVNVDWVPGKGMHATLNGKTLTVEGHPPYLNNELMYRVMLRMYLVASGSDEMRENLLNKSRSMLSPPQSTTASQ
jgi:hypothetical protein